MKKLKTAVSIALVFLMLAACGAAPSAPATTQPTTVPNVPETAETIPEATEPPPTTAPPETTEPVVEVTIPEGYNYSFFWFTTFLPHSYCTFSVAPAGTEDWCPVYFDRSYICYNHPKTEGGSLDDNASIVRGYFFYDGPPTTRWILRLEPPTEGVEHPFENFPYTSEYKWDTEFELDNNQTILCLWSVDYLESLSNPPTDLSDEDIASGFIPVVRPMEFCENCPESWLEPVG